MACAEDGCWLCVCLCAVPVSRCGACAPAGCLVPKKLLDLLCVLRARFQGLGAKNSPDPGKSACYLIPLPGSECPRCPAGAVRALPRRAAEPGAEPPARAAKGGGSRGLGQGGWEKTCPPRPPADVSAAPSGAPGKSAAHSSAPSSAHSPALPQRRRSRPPPGPTSRGAAAGTGRAGGATAGLLLRRERAMPLAARRLAPGARRLPAAATAPAAPSAGTSAGSGVGSAGRSRRCSGEGSLAAAVVPGLRCWQASAAGQPGAPWPRDGQRGRDRAAGGRRGGGGGRDGRGDRAESPALGTPGFGELPDGVSPTEAPLALFERKRREEEGGIPEEFGSRCLAAAPSLPAFRPAFALPVQPLLPAVFTGDFFFLSLPVSKGLTVGTKAGINGA